MDDVRARPKFRSDTAGARGGRAARAGATACVAAACALASGACSPPGAADAGCTEEAIGAADAGAGAFAAPSAVAVVGDAWLLVANASFRYACGRTVYDPASVTVLALDDLSVVARLPTAAPNAQFLTPVAAGDAAWVVSSGPSRFDGTVVWPEESGAVERISLDATGASPPGVDRTILVPSGGAADPTLGYPSRLALSPDEATGLAGSGTAGATFRLDLAAESLLQVFVPFPQADGLNGAAEARLEGGALHLLAFNDDAYCVGPWSGGALDIGAFACADVGDSPELLEGPLDVALDAAGTTAWVVMSAANAVHEVDLTGGAPAYTGLRLPAGVAPNRIVRDGTRYLVVSSGSNAIYTFAAGDTETALLSALPPATNPVDLAIDAARGRAFVPGLLSDDVSVIDLATGEVLEVLR